MVRTNSTMLPLGTPIPPFDLPMVQSHRGMSRSEWDCLEHINNQSLSSQPVLFMFICAHCPFVKHIEEQLTQLDQDYGHQIQIIAISSNSLITHPQDGPEELADQSNRNNWKFPYLIDKEQTFAKALRAACTPDFFLFSSIIKGNSIVLTYRGQLDDSRPGNDLPVTGNDLRKALDLALHSKPISEDQKPSIGCNIKWHPGEEPDWFG